MKAMNGNIRYNQHPQLIFATWNDKFPEEKVCFEDDSYLIHFDGVILNSEDLKRQLHCASNQEILLQLYRAHGAELVFYAKGIYSLVLWDKEAQTLLITNDLLSKRSLFYCKTDDMLCYGSSYHDLLDTLSRENHQPKINLNAFQDMLRRGFVEGVQTYLEQVSYLDAFESIWVDLRAGASRIIRHPMKAVTIPAGEDAIIDQFHALFSAAVQLQYQKNAAYGYTQCTTLSGGMDSRANLLTARKLGFDKDIVCFNYAQVGSLDSSISREIATDLGLDYIFYPMDAAVFLGRLQDATFLNECMQSGIGATGARTMATLLNTSNFGLINIGICGGELMGDLVQRNRGKEPSNKLIRYSLRAYKKFKELLTKPEPKAENYTINMQEYLCHLRASQNFAHMFIDKCECISPFMDEDVVMYVLQLNPGLLYDRRLYRKWMIKFIPNDYIITSSCTTIDGSVVQEWMAKLKYRYLRKRNGVSQWDMNPIAHWFEVNSRHANHCQTEYESGCDWLAEADSSNKFLPLVQQSWNNPWLKRLYVLTALQALKDIHARFQKIT